MDYSREHDAEAQRKKSPGKQFYRCVMCSGVVSEWDIKEGVGCRKCGGLKVKPSNLSLWEKIVQIIRHPKVWDWNV